MSVVAVELGAGGSGSSSFLGTALLQEAPSLWDWGGLRVATAAEGLDTRGKFENVEKYNNTQTRHVLKTQFTELFINYQLFM